MTVLLQLSHLSRNARIGSVLFIMALVVGFVLQRHFSHPTTIVTRGESADQHGTDANQPEAAAIVGTPVPVRKNRPLPRPFAAIALEEPPPLPPKKEHGKKHGRKPKKQPPVPSPTDWQDAWGPESLKGQKNCPPVFHQVLVPEKDWTVEAGVAQTFFIQLRTCPLNTGSLCSNDTADVFGKFEERNGQDIYVWFYGPSMFAGDIWLHDVSRGVIRVEFRAMEPGPYVVRFVQWHNSKSAAKSGEFCIRQFSPLTRNLVVLPPKGEDSDYVPPWPRKQCNDLVPSPEPRTGRWLRCEDIMLHYTEHYTGCPRMGWLWLPHDCHYQFFSPRALLAQTLPTWIVVFSSSLLRSIFWYFMDTLGGHRRINKVTWKCWGWMDIQVGSLRISWRDWRLIGFRAVPAHYEKDYMKHFEAFMKELSAAAAPPDIYVFETLHLAEEADIIVRLGNLRGSTSNFIFTNVQVGRPDRSAFEGFVKRKKVPAEIEAAVKEHGLSFGYVDVFTMAYPVLHDLETPLPTVAKHHQRQCGGGHVCALQMDMASQMILNAAAQRNSLLDKKKPTKHVEWHPYDAASPDAKLCTLCPKKAFVLPFLFHSSVEGSSCSKLSLEPDVRVP
eukprot:TRINITY_DN5956_c0_g1_i2.p1 TRINITY_DN5956_c0_g1~~TRINITY_DN5956_c0_g1_i2.p1  ORF type:complete len:612 (-),score=71.56 TRINITY_DN5956_c0_g1_i2:2412-4247(-)